METNNSQLVIYKAPDGTMSIDVTVQNETVWLSQGQMAELFGKDQSVIARHISNVFKEGELEKESNMQILHNTLSKFKPTQVYSLDVIISVGYRVKSKRGTQFRIWANQVLQQYLLQGYAINERVATQKYDELSQLVKVLGRTIQNQEKLTEDSRSLADIVEANLGQTVDIQSVRCGEIPGIHIVGFEGDVDRITVSHEIGRAHV